MKSNAKLLLVTVLCSAQIISCKKDELNAPAPVGTVSMDAAATDSSLAKGMVAWYTFNGDILDHSGNNNNVIFNSAKPAKGKAGLAKTAYVFDGTTSYMMANNSASLNSGKITLYALIKPTGFYQGKCHSNRIITKGNTDLDNGRYSLGFDDQPYYNYTGCDVPEVKTKFENFYGSFGNGPFITGATDIYNYIKTNQWYSLVYTYDGTYSTLYINGVIVRKVAQSAAFTPNTTPLFIGRAGDTNYPYFFKGVIDEIRIYKRALNANEILRLYNVNN